ncbi:MAG: molecular chaperone HtpG [Ruminococcus sp.]|nr:molecular chaperone HtpG [Ruminococcus sp.]
METKEFKAESKRLLEMMINSIYTHKEIFLRELISNASDAIDKLYFKSLTDSSVGLKKDDFEIFLELDKDNRTLVIKDNGIGMTKEELENNLGTIAKSGSLAFKSENDASEDIDIVGQFGVGFYSAFMVAKEVEVKSLAFGSDTAYVWKSEGVSGYTIDECEKDTVGTVITLKIKDNTDDENYDEYLEQYKIESLIKKYSDYIRFPIKMEVEVPHFEEDKETTYTKEIKTLNSMVPIWKKNKSELKDEDYNAFYTDKFMDYQPPLAHIHAKNEGVATYDALMFIPSKAPYNYYSKNYEKGLQLYSSGVMIMENCSDLLPDYLSFVQGLVDSQDLSLNISREMLQHDRQLKIIAKNIEKSIKNELNKMLKNKREDYEKFYKEFGLQLKFGIYQSYGAAKDILEDLLMFTSSFENKPVTLSEYVSRMADDQKYIYYACGESAARIDMLPQAEAVKDSGYELLYFTDDVDEFAIKMLGNYKEKEFKSISASDLDLSTESEKEEVKKEEESSKDMFEYMKNSLGDKVSSVRLSNKLKSHPVCLTADGEVSLEMEKVLNSMPNNNESIKSQKALEINPNHPIFAKLKSLYESDKEKLDVYTELLYNQALLIEGISIENPLDFSNKICDLMI